ncbi:MAG: hypothetical protein A3A97_02805 [Candidatus Terrybacteria bacterium RIFCSPLOWO2_01_FULL_40_23]|uniref:Uncharacterized protein n=1 Tax=Candidatus Terrybacteria bacterium RIFCSPLOWO2_01_FULL_40_23 TaxID=1802366 RepID=A0A1G2PSA0_9BACT|nr:MAG: hypothetical protein A3A97_02805 [Candidatus Terrybacteria bacterium RIFCSPLOWO2_01_FULL_40_23]
MNPESMLKGRMAETLFEELMRQSGNIVYRFGYEAIVQNLTQLEEKFDRYSEVGEKIRAIPDFIVVDKKGKPTFVEVKFRWKPELHKSDFAMLEQIHKLWSPKIIFINCWEQPYFRISDPPYIKNNLLVSKPLVQETDWRIGKSLYDTYEELVHRYLTPTLIPSRNKN